MKTHLSLVCAIAAIMMLTAATPVMSPNEVKIGEKIWMTQNLNVDKFRNGDPIPEARTAEEWMQAGNDGKPAWCYYDNDPANASKYGKLYNWYAVNDERGLAPAGWHVPSDDEWKAMAEALGGQTAAGSKLRSKTGWDDAKPHPSPSGFNAVPGGHRSFSGDFNGRGYIGAARSSTTSRRAVGTSPPMSTTSITAMA